MTLGPVLIVEDDAELSLSLRDMIRALGYDAICASNGREALARLRELTPSLLLVDLFMPVMGGIEFLHVIKGEPRLSAIPKVIITAANDQMVGVKEDVSVLHKPVDLEVLAQVLKQHCR
jgi:CheY-like chemotaxis protein